MLPHEFRTHADHHSVQQEPHHDIDPEKLDKSDHKSSFEEDIHWGEGLPTMTSSLPMIQEEGHTPKPSGSGSHVMWPTDDTFVGSEV